jgi:preprotein translocase subunit SecG
MTFQIILTIHVLIAIGLVAIILLQQGKGADAGAAFGSGSAGSVFGAGGAGSFLYKLTRGLALGFFATSLLLAYIASSDSKPEATESNSIIQEGDVPSVPVVPVANDEVPKV